MTAAEAGASSSNQKLAAKATTTATQIRIPKSQALTGAPAKINGRGTVAVVMEAFLAWETAGAQRRQSGGDRWRRCLTTHR